MERNSNNEFALSESVMPRGSSDEDHGSSGSSKRKASLIVAIVIVIILILVGIILGMFIGARAWNPFDTEEPSCETGSTTEETFTMMETIKTPGPIIFTESITLSQPVTTIVTPLFSSMYTTTIKVNSTVLISMISTNSDTSKTVTVTNPITTKGVLEKCITTATSRDIDLTNSFELYITRPSPWYESAWISVSVLNGLCMCGVTDEQYVFMSPKTLLRTWTSDFETLVIITRSNAIELRCFSEDCGIMVGLISESEIRGEHIVNNNVTVYDIIGRDELDSLVEINHFRRTHICYRTDVYDLLVCRVIVTNNYWLGSYQFADIEAIRTGTFKTRIDVLGQSLPRNNNVTVCTCVIYGGPIFCYIFDDNELVCITMEGSVAIGNKLKYMGRIVGITMGTEGLFVMNNGISRGFGYKKEDVIEGIISINGVDKSINDFMIEREAKFPNIILYSRSGEQLFGQDIGTKKYYGSSLASYGPCSEQYRFGEMCICK